MHFNLQHFITSAENSVELNGLDNMSIEMEGTTNFAFGAHTFFFVGVCYALRNALIYKNGKVVWLKAKLKLVATEGDQLEHFVHRRVQYWTSRSLDLEPQL
jgi:hypothetical protein